MRFWVDVFAFCALLVLYTYIVLSPFEDDVSIPEWCLLTWFVTLLLEEVRQVGTTI
jgi:hypothetical protein